MAQTGTEGVPDGQGAAEGQGAADVVRPGTGVVRPGSGQGAAGAAGVVRPPAGGSAGVVRPGEVAWPGAAVVRPGTDVVRPGTAAVEGAAKAVAAVPDVTEAPPEPIRVVLPVIPVKAVKQGFLDRLVAGKSDAEKAADEARKQEEARRKAEEAQRKAEEKAHRAAAEAQRKEAEKARKEAEEARRAEVEAEQKARAQAEEKARRDAEARARAEEKARRRERAQQEALEAEAAEDERDDEPSPPRGLAGPAAPPRPAPPAPTHQPARPPMGPAGPPRPAPPPPPPGAPPGPPRPGARPGPPGRPMGPPHRGPRMPVGRGPQPYERADLDDGYDDYDDEYDQPRRRPLRQWIAAGIALLALGGGSFFITGVVAPDATAAYRAGLDFGDPAPILGALGESAPVPSHAGLETVLGPLIASPSLGFGPAATVADVETGQILWGSRGDAPMVPASSAKVLTAAAVLAAYGPNYRIPTRAVAGTTQGDVFLVGGGDPVLAINEKSAYRDAARLDKLAEQVRATLGGASPGRIIVDISLFTGPNIHPTWGGGDLGGTVAPIVPLMTDGARVNPLDTRFVPPKYGQPHVAAAQAFARALGVPVSQVVVCSSPRDPSCVAPPGARVLGEVFSPALAGIVERMVADSDNTVAEVLSRHVALAKGTQPSFDGAAQATRQVLAEIGVPMPGGVGLVDGSGLSYSNTVTANQILAVLLTAASPEHPQLRAVLTGLAVAGYSGTMDDAHFRGDAGEGVVRAKTGTLTGVNALVGLVTDADGRLLAFALIANGTGGDPENRLDDITRALSQCGCR